MSTQYRISAECWGALAGLCAGGDAELQTARTAPDARSRRTSS
jgi:hypothetical protein